MRRVGQFLLPMVLTALVATEVTAQACLGMPSFEDRAVHLNAGGEFPDSARAFTIGLGAGKHNGLFANVGVGQISYDYVGVDSKTNLGFLEFGFQYPVAGIQFCPIAGGYFATGPDDALARISVTSRAATAGLAAGYPFQASMLTLIPNASARFEYLSQKVEEEDVASETTTYETWVLDVGLAFVLANRLSVQPIVHFPLSGEEKDATVGIVASVGFGLP